MGDKMKKLYILFLSLITSLICISCKNSFIMEKSEIIVPDCVHGKIEIKPDTKKVNQQVLV